ncbi:MAG: methyltransferase domain-containing protein [Anaerolineaceae bacterium]
MNEARVSSSFRDPSGFLFTRNGVLYRQVNQFGAKTYDKFISSGLYEELTRRGWLVAHTEVEVKAENPEIAYRILQPDLVPFISYPYEWSFSQLKDAALSTLEINKLALSKGMILKDASAYNIQFVDGKPVLIDTLSFDLYRKGSGWDGYRQFCQHFLAPLSLASLVDVRFMLLSKNYIDGIPLDLVSRLLPGKTRFGLSGLNIHIHMHARVQREYADKQTTQNNTGLLTKESLLNMLKGLSQTVEKLTWQPKGTEWGDYYSATNYSDDSLRLKGEMVGSFIDQANPAKVWDLGANNGLFSREAAKRGIFTVASDIDPAAVEKNYLTIKANQEKNLMPLVMDLTNPSPSIGWANQERDAFNARGPVDMILALALIHHLAISNNLPLDAIADYFASISNWAVVEFVPKSDSQVKRLLATRKDIFDQYTEEGFEAAFSRVFKIANKQPLAGSERTLYLLKKK